MQKIQREATHSQESYSSFNLFHLLEEPCEEVIR